jgi:glycosyltransferase involved in cell wall biosynthesis
MDARAMNVWLYRRRLSFTSGAGQLVRMQAEGLEQAGVKPALMAEHGRLHFFLRTGRRVESISLTAARALARSSSGLFVDHSARVPEAQVVFVHNLASAAARHVPEGDFADALPDEQAFFASLDARARLVANSAIVKDAIAADYGIEPARVDVLHPGYDRARFTPATRAHLRDKARAALGIDGGAPLVGFVTSGSLVKRGIDVFLDAAARIQAERRDARFLIVGSSRLPERARRHALYRDGLLRHRPKSRRPERWFAALDVFLYPAHWEEYGMVVTEALAMGLPVLTSRRVGAAACLPEAFTPWIADAPSAEVFAERALSLLGDPDAGRRLSAAGLESVVCLGDDRYGALAARTILDSSG